MTELIKKIDLNILKSKKAIEISNELIVKMDFLIQKGNKILCADNCNGNRCNTAE